MFQGRKQLHFTLGQRDTLALWLIGGSGKTVAAINDLIRACYTTPLENVRVAYIAPYLSQSKAIAWDYLLEYTAAIPDIKVNIAELRIDFPNGARIRLFGADNYNAMRGLYFDAVVLDEPADFPASAWPTVIRPALADRKGKATFIGTPKGKMSSGKSTVTPKTIRTGTQRCSKRQKQEYWIKKNLTKQDAQWAMTATSKSLSVLSRRRSGGLLAVETERRHERQPHYSCAIRSIARRCDSLGRCIGDSTAIWFAQFYGQEIRIIDYHENSEVGLDTYAKALSEKPYHYEQHILPHDVRVQGVGTGKSRLETLEALGIRDVEIAPKLSVDDGIQAARSMLARCWFDGGNCERGIEALRQYRRDFDEKLKTWRGRPLHDWTSHGADAFRYLAVGYKSQRIAGTMSRLEGICAASPNMLGCS